MAYTQVNSDIKYLNLGCGYRFNSMWTNVNFVATGKEVIAHDLNQGIPFADNTFDLVYHSHLLEHFTKAAAVSFMQECFRVLRPGGILRVAVPDLEQIARIYLNSLEQADSSTEWAASYEWIALELLDQMVRNRRGGEMATYLAEAKNCDRDFALERFGVEASRLRTVTSGDLPFKNWLRSLKQVGRKVHQLLPRPWQSFYTALKVGYYRQSGEVHQWMYDRYSLSTVLTHCGFEQIVQRTATDSYLNSWQSFNLDTEPDGSVYKPDSLFMEAYKPID
ncbi:MAG: methyltransferase domain-containing protein [Cyanobacteria bacterium J06623_7]